MEGAAPQRLSGSTGRGRFGARASVSTPSSGETSPHWGVLGRCLHCLRPPLLLGAEVLGRGLKVWVECRDGVSCPLGCKRWVHVVGLWPSVATQGQRTGSWAGAWRLGSRSFCWVQVASGQQGPPPRAGVLGGTRCCHSDLVFLAWPLLPGLSSASDVPPTPARCQLPP